MLLCIGLSGCDQISNIFLTDEDKLVGTWNSEEGIWFEVPTTIVFSPNGTFSVQVELGVPLPIDLSLSKGRWEMHNGVLTMEIVDFIPANNYTYQFLEDNKTLQLMDTDSSYSYILKKQ